jgi:hypothetical protein
MSDNSSRIIITKTSASTEEVDAYRTLAGHLKDSPVPGGEILGNLGLYLTRSSLSRILFMHDLYQRILTAHGVIMEFGVRWGQNVALFTTFRSMYEPYNYNRKVIGFDTFEGFPHVAAEDGRAESVVVGGLRVTDRYDARLVELLLTHERLAPRSHLQKFELVKGDVIETLPRYLAEHPETIISLAYFDLDLYEPTRRCLELILPHMTRNSVIGFDEANYAPYPGETLALKEMLPLRNCKLHRSPLSINQSYLTFE